MDNLGGFREEKKVASIGGESVPITAPPMEGFDKALRDYALPPVGIPSIIQTYNSG